MSDPATIVVAALIALGGAVHTMDIPQDLKDVATQAIKAAEQSAPSATQQIERATGGLPQPVQSQVDTAIADSAAQLEDAIHSHLPPDSAQPPMSQVDPTSAATPTIERLPAGNSSLPDAADVTTSNGHVSSAASIASPLHPVGSIAPFIPWLKKAGGLCEGITAPVIAALYAAENGFRYGPGAPTSPAGASGPGQFMPATWAVYGKDADGNGVADIMSIADSVMASGQLLCDLHTQVESWISQGVVSGDPLDLTLAGYNAGAGAVLGSHGMPSGTRDYETQTKPYVAKIRASEAEFAPLVDVPVAGGGAGIRIIEQATRYIGLPYVWGGGNSDGPSMGGFDCSGLTSFAVHAASAGAVTLPRTSESQWSIGTEIPLDQAQPGDLLFGNWGSDGPGHVAIYIGGGQMVHAPTTGDIVRISPIFTGMRARRVM